MTRGGEIMARLSKWMKRLLATDFPKQVAWVMCIKLF